MKLTPGRYRVFAELVNQLQDRERRNVTTRSIADEIGRSATTVHDHIVALWDAGLVRRSPIGITPTGLELAREEVFAPVRLVRSGSHENMIQVRRSGEWTDLLPAPSRYDGRVALEILLALAWRVPA